MPEYVRVRVKNELYIRDLQRGMKSSVQKAIDKQLQHAVLIAKSRVPYLTGRLQRSLRVLRLASDAARGITGRMGSRQPYANKINLQQRANTGRGYMDEARASLVNLSRTLRQEWAKTIAQKQLNRRRN